MKDEKFELLQFALRAYDDANVHAMRLWYVASLISVSILTSAAGLGDISAFLDEDFNIAAALPALLLALSALNLIFVVAQVSHYRMAEIYRSIVYEHFSVDEKVSGQYTWRDLAFRSQISAYNRIMPLLDSIGMREDWLATKLGKFLFDCFFAAFPIFGLIVGLYVLPSTSFFYTFISVIGFISVGASLIIAKYAYAWAFRK